MASEQGTEDGGRVAREAVALMEVCSKALELEPNDPEVSPVSVCVLFPLLEGSQKPGPVLVYASM